MPYVREKKVKRYHYHRLVESHRVDGKPRQKVLMHLSQHPTVDAALAGWPKEISDLRRLARQHSKRYEFVCLKSLVTHDLTDTYRNAPTVRRSRLMPCRLG
jgi:hypothetical protein